jgi:hypothetical protein
MDLRLFHSTENPDHNYNTFDRHNSRTGIFACRLLEWSGWYSASVPLRLLGHYRLFQLYKKDRLKTSASLPPVQGYILQCRSAYWIRHYWYIFISRFPSMWKHPDEGVEIYAVNKLLLYERASILAGFLADAETDFEQAFKNALKQIYAPEFINKDIIVEKQILEREKEIIIKAPDKELTGKEKGVFSKKQVLIFFDLLYGPTSRNRFPFEKPEKLPAIAAFFQALTGKGIDTWLETLKDYRSNDLYACNTPGERSNLIGTLTNLADIARAAGLRDIAFAANKKIKQLKAGK